MNVLQRRPRLVLGLLLLMALAWIVPVQAQEAPLKFADDALEYGELVNQAAIAGDLASLGQARANLPNMFVLLSREPDMMSVYYSAGYSSWEFSLQAPDPGQATGAAYDAASQIRTGIGFKIKFDELQVLAAMIHAQILKLSNGKVPFDPAIGTAFTEAVAAQPKNPRFAFAQGVVAFLAPRAFGAKPGDAEEAFKRAQTLFAGEPADKPWPNWGRPQSEAWLGRVLASKGDTAGATAAYERALKIEPNYVWVKKTLLPALKPAAPKPAAAKPAAPNPAAKPAPKPAAKP